MYDLEERTLRLAVSVRMFINLLPKTVSNIEDAKQLVRSSPNAKTTGEFLPEKSLLVLNLFFFDLFGIWCLAFGIYLVFGTWNLEFTR